MKGLLGLLSESNSTAPTGTMTRAELEALKFAQMKAQLDEMSRARQMGDVYTTGTPENVQFLRQWNPLANTMQNIPPYAGGVSMQNVMPPKAMDLNSLLRMLGR